MHFSPPNRKDTVRYLAQIRYGTIVVYEEEVEADALLTAEVKALDSFTACVTVELTKIEDDDPSDEDDDPSDFEMARINPFDAEHVPYTREYQDTDEDWTER